ncbi:uncharacterized protein LOC135223125 [Macrobrachium nipponense]|uniref:uncharacterized protein LOC135223125 n=1 Tax=Macrobrachium nipponense TaxID=159736 RepID=UPI0030C7B2C6
MKILTLLVNILNLIGCKSTSLPEGNRSRKLWHKLFRDVENVTYACNQVIPFNRLPKEAEEHFNETGGFWSLSFDDVRRVGHLEDFISRLRKGMWQSPNGYDTGRQDIGHPENISAIHLSALEAALDFLDSLHSRRDNAIIRVNPVPFLWQDVFVMYAWLSWVTIFTSLIVAYSTFSQSKEQHCNAAPDQTNSPVIVRLSSVPYQSRTHLMWLLVMGTFFALHDGGEAAVHLQTDDVARGESGLTWRYTLPTLQEFTFCVRLYSYRSRYSDYFFSYAIRDSDNELAFHIKYDIKELRMACCGKRIFHILDIDLAPLRWFYFCAAVNLSSLTATFVHSLGTANGTLDDSRKGLREPLLVNGGGIVILGQDQDEPGGGTDKEQSFNGIISDLYLMKGLATHQQMMEYIECNNDAIWQSSPLIHFHNISQDFKLGPYTEEKRNMSTCPPNNKIYSIFPEPRNYKEALHFCSILNGRMALPLDDEDNVMLYSEGKNYSVKCSAFEKSGGVWVGVEWNNKKRIWQNTYTKQASTFKNFGVEISPTAEDPLCVLSRTHSDSTDIRRDGNWDIELCSRSVCTACQFEDSRPLKIRGLCEESIFDRQYYVYNRINERPVFNGMRWTKIAWNNSQSAYDYTWVLYQIAEPNVQARMVRKSELEYPIGVHEFEVVGDKCPGKLIQLKLTSCPDGMYTCSDGSCIKIDKRCDLELDCADRGDELGCVTVILPPGYDKRIPPPKIDSSTPAQISFDFIIRLIRKFSLLDSNLVVDFLITRSWFDSRVQYKNLHETKNLNLIDGIVDVIWYPDVTLLGADQSIATSEILSTTGWGQRLTEPEPDDDKRLDEDVFFSGSGNLLMLERELTVTLMCTFDLTMYPFDSQRCPLIFYVGDYTKHYVSTVLNKVEFTGTRRLFEYLVTSIEHEPLIYQNKSGQQIQIVMTNLYGYYISGAYIPTLLLVIISYSTFYFPLEDFTNRIMVSLTSLLVLASLFSQIASGLPKTAYMKLIDVWFIFCILVDFVMVILLVIINSLVDSQVSHTPIQVLSANDFSGKVPVMKSALRVDGKLWNKMSLILLPICVGLFIIVYFSGVAYNLGSVKDTF